MVALHDACTKLSALSDDRARRVVELIEDLAELEALKKAQAEVRPEKTVPSAEGEKHPEL